MEQLPNEIKTGNNLVQSNEIDPEILKTTEGLMFTLIEKAVLTAAKYAKTAGRDNVSSTDMVYALQFEAHEFMKHEDLEQRIEENKPMSEEDQSENEEDQSENEEDQSENEEDQSENEEFTRAPDTDPFCEKINQYHDNWDSWTPTERVEITLKNAVDKVLNNFNC